VKKSGRKLQDPNVRRRVVEVISRNGPSEVQSVANELHVTWSTARAILLDLVLEGRLRVMRTTGGFVFLPIEGLPSLAEEKTVQGPIASEAQT
jgi:hypothetical protein